MATPLDDAQDEAWCNRHLRTWRARFEREGRELDQALRRRGARRGEPPPTEPPK